MKRHHKRDDIPPLPEAYREEFARLSSHIRDAEMNPPYRVGSCVQRRPGTLGATGWTGVVRQFFWSGSHLCAEVDFGYGRIERFMTSAYTR